MFSELNHRIAAHRVSVLHYKLKNMGIKFNQHDHPDIAKLKFGEGEDMYTIHIPLELYHSQHSYIRKVLQRYQDAYAIFHALLKDMSKPLRRVSETNNNKSNMA